MSDIYLRDLIEPMQEDFKRNWKKNGREDLLKIVEEGEEDISIGEYCKDGEEKLV